MTSRVEVLTTRIRKLMLAEVESDVRDGCLYKSPRLSAAGALSGYLAALRKAIAHGTEQTLAAALSRGGFVKWHEVHHTKNGRAFVRSVPRDASTLLAAESFNRYCLRALRESVKQDGLEPPPLGHADDSVST